MPQVCGSASPGGEYWIDVLLGGQVLKVLEPVAAAIIEAGLRQSGWAVRAAS